jgi:nocturnin
LLTVRCYPCAPRQSHSPCEPLGFPSDGLALFYRADRLSQIAPPSRAFYTDANGDALNQCRLLAPLLDRASGRALVVATTHLKAKDGAEQDAVRLAEAQQARSVARGHVCLVLVR